MRSMETAVNDMTLTAVASYALPPAIFKKDPSPCKLIPVSDHHEEFT